MNFSKFCKVASMIIILINLGVFTACGNKMRPTNPVNQLVPPTQPNVPIHVTTNTGNTICGYSNAACVSVTVCNPNLLGSCVTVNNILIDSGSFGLRVYSTALGEDFADGLPMEIKENNPIAECVTYADNTANWGPIVLANVTLSSSLGTQSTVESLPIQVIDLTFPGAAENCNSAINTPDPASFGLNGILGVGPLINDDNNYFVCSGTRCTSTSLSEKNQVSNPIAFMSRNYQNGITFKFPELNSNGGSGAIGYAIFGVGTNVDNTPNGSVNYYPIDTGATIPITMNTLYKGTDISGFLDTGSNAYFFYDNALPICDDWYCPSNQVALTSFNGESLIPNNFYINNSNTLFSTDNGSFSNLGGPIEFGFYFDYGLSFFFGKTVYICFEGKTCAGRTGPYWAF